MSTASAGTITSPPRWSAEETKKIAQIRARLGPVLLDRPQFPDVVGDRKLVRFLRGHEHNVDKVCEMVPNFLRDFSKTKLFEFFIICLLSNPGIKVNRYKTKPTLNILNSSK